MLLRIENSYGKIKSMSAWCNSYYNYIIVIFHVYALVVARFYK